jgi:aminoglycoside phosphotransferase (APT) family kinase protein
MKNEISIKLIQEIEKRLFIKIVKTTIPPQGMDSQVFIVIDSKVKEYVIKFSKWALNDKYAYDLINKHKLNIPIPKVLCSFVFDENQVLVLEKINYPLLESVNDKSKYIPSMINCLKSIHEIKSDIAGQLNTKLNKTWKEILLSKFNGNDELLDWGSITKRKCLDKDLILKSIDKLVIQIEEKEFLTSNYSLLHPDFNQRNLFIDPNSNKITGIIDWSESMFGDPIYDLARLRMFIWHFKLGEEVLQQYYSLVNFNEKDREIEQIYFVSFIIEYLAYYSEELDEFNKSRLLLHQEYLREYIKS